MKAVLFDLDDTLYPEMEFVRGGFRAVARHLAAGDAPREAGLFERMFSLLEREGRGRIFDTLLREEVSGEAADVPRLVRIYRTHSPSIRLYPDAERALGDLRAAGHRLGLVTDGMGSVQRSKIAALGLPPLLDAIVCTDEIGRDHWKPSPVPFRIACELLGVGAREAAYVGDDPSKDFAAPNALGMLTVQVVRPGAPDRGRGDAGARARHVVGGLEDVAPLVIGGGHGH